MLHLVIRLRGGDLRLWAASFIVCLLCGLSLSGSTPALGQYAPTGGGGTYLPAGSGRFYYLTGNTTTLLATQACDTGYHMASMWELVDLSGLTYDFQHPGARSKADDGSGPIGMWDGWVHTGGDGSGADVAGQANCQAWSSAAGADFGTSVRLTNNWGTASGSLGPWRAITAPCNLPGSVWCVGDFASSYLPLLRVRQ